jgi:hypothetical protein
MDWAHIRGVFRQERCGQSFGVCSSDTFHLGLRGVAPGGKAQDFGLLIDTRKPDQCEAWRRIRDKAKADIDKFDREMAVRRRAEQITDSEFDVWFETITKGKHEHAHNNS